MFFTEGVLCKKAQHAMGKRKCIAHAFHDLSTRHGLTLLIYQGSKVNFYFFVKM